MNTESLNKVMLLKQQSDNPDIILPTNTPDVSKKCLGSLSPLRPESLSDLDINTNVDSVILTPSDPKYMKPSLAKSLTDEAGLDCLDGLSFLSTDLNTGVLNTHSVKRHKYSNSNKIGEAIRRYPTLKEYLNTVLTKESQSFINRCFQTNGIQFAYENVLFNKSKKCTFDTSILMNRDSFQSETTAKILNQLGLRNQLQDSSIGKSTSNQKVIQENLLGLTERSTKYCINTDIYQEYSKSTSNFSMGSYTETLGNIPNSSEHYSITNTDMYSPIMQNVELDITVINNLVFTTTDSLTIPTRTGYKTLKSIDQIHYLIESLLTGYSVPSESTNIIAEVANYINKVISDNNKSIDLRTIIPGVRIVLHDSLLNNTKEGYTISNFSIVFDEAYLAGINSEILESLRGKFLQLHVTNIQFDASTLKIEDLPLTKMPQDSLSIEEKLIDLRVRYKALNNSALDLGKAELIGIYQHNENTLYYYSYITGKSSLVEKLDTNRFTPMKFESEDTPTPQDPYLGIFNTIATIVLYLPGIYGNITQVLRSGYVNNDDVILKNLNKCKALPHRILTYMKCGPTETSKHLSSRYEGTLNQWSHALRNIENEWGISKTSPNSVVVKGNINCKKFNRGFNRDNTFDLTSSSGYHKSGNSIDQNLRSTSFGSYRSIAQLRRVSLGDLNNTNGTSTNWGSLEGSINIYNLLTNTKMKDNMINTNLDGMEEISHTTYGDYFESVNNCLFSLNCNTKEEALDIFKSLQETLLQSIINLSNLINQFSNIETTKDLDNDINILNNYI